MERRGNSVTEKERLQLRLQPKTREKIERWQSAAGCCSMNKSVEKAANFYTAYLTSDDSSVLLSPAIQSAIDGQLQGFKEQIGYKRYIVTEIIPNDRRPTRKQDQLITKPTKDFMDVKELLEYEDYVQKPTKAHASSLITLILEEYWKQVQQTDGYLKYIAMQPRAERLGYNNAQAWRALLRAHHNDIAAAMNFHVSYIFQHNAAAVTAQPRLHIDCKQMQELQKLRIALGHQPDNHEEEQTRSRGGMTMKGW